MKFRNAQFIVSGAVDCEIEHPKYGWIPFTASPDDVEDLGRQIFAAAKGAAAPYAGPSPEQIAVEARAEEVRTQRNSLLAASDWTQVADAPVDQVAWATYRQALRGITAQVGFPETIDWPVAPE